MKHYTFAEVQSLAKRFLMHADIRKEQVSNFINGSIKDEDVDGYLFVTDMYIAFVDALNAYNGSEDYDYSIDYDLAESVLEKR